MADQGECNPLLKEKRLVIVAIDSSEQAEYAFDWYRKYLHHPENEIMALHCPEGFDLTRAHDAESIYETLEVTRSGYNRHPVTIDIGHQSQEKELTKSGQLKENTEMQYSKITELEERYHHKMHVAKLKGVVLSIPGKNAGQTIVDSAREEGAMAIVMGTRSRSLIQKAFQGSVSEYVLKNADIPVIIVPRKRK